MRLTNPTDDELNAAFAEHVAGWERWSQNEKLWIPAPGCSPVYEPPQFTRSADAVLPWLEKTRWWYCDGSARAELAARYCVQVGGIDNYYTGYAPILAEAVVIALLRAHGVEVEFTK